MNIFKKINLKILKKKNRSIFIILNYVWIRKQWSTSIAYTYLLRVIPDKHFNMLVV